MKNIKSFLTMIVLWVITIAFGIFMTSCESRSSRASGNKHIIESFEEVQMNNEKVHSNFNTYAITLLINFNTGEKDTVVINTLVHPTKTMEQIVDAISFTQSRHNCVVLPGKPDQAICDVYLFRVWSIELLDTT